MQRSLPRPLGRFWSTPSRWASNFAGVVRRPAAAATGVVTDCTNTAAVRPRACASHRTGCFSPRALMLVVACQCAAGPAISWGQARTAAPLRSFSSSADSSSSESATGACPAPHRADACASGSSDAVAAAAADEVVLSPQFGLPVRADLPEFTWEEVYKHDRPDSYWIVLDSHVYDITSYVARHPGGGIEETFSRTHGTDVGASFHELHGRGVKQATLQFLIGRIKPGSVTTRVPKARPVPASLELDDMPLTDIADSTTTMKQ